jgi:CRP/FNR family transcriptional regulator, cyclic AMP receptor protein
MVDAATVVWSTPDVAPRQIERATVEVLSQVRIFATLPRRHLNRVAAVATAKRYPPNSLLVRVGTPADAFYVILSGNARVEVPGRPVALEAGDFFGEMALIDGEPRAATVTATTDVLVLMIARAKFLKLLEAEPKVALAIMATLTRRLRDTASQVPATILL